MPNVQKSDWSLSFIRDDITGTEHNYLFSSGMVDNHRGICFRKDEKTMRVYGAVGLGLGLW